MSASGISVRSVKLMRCSRLILDIPELDIERGEFVNISGSNGAGKTTLLKVICGLVRPSAGTVMINGTSVNTLSSWRKSNIRKNIGYIPQALEYNAELPFTARDVVAMGRVSRKPLFSRLDKEDRRVVSQWLERLDIEKLSDQVFRTLSGGERQKVLIARSMVQKPDMLVLDEPAAGLDSVWKLTISDIIDELHALLGLTVLVVSHESSVFSPSTGRNIYMDGGTIRHQAEALRGKGF